MLRKQVIILNCLNNEGGTFLIKIEYSYKRDLNCGGLLIPIAAEVTARPLINASPLNHAIQEDFLPDIPRKIHSWQKVEELTSPLCWYGNARLCLDKTDPDVWEIDIVDVISPQGLVGPSTNLPGQVRERRLPSSSNPSGGPKLVASETIPYMYEGRNGTRLARFHESQQES